MVSNQLRTEGENCKRINPGKVVRKRTIEMRPERPHIENPMLLVRPTVLA